MHDQQNIKNCILSQHFRMIFFIDDAKNEVRSTFPAMLDQDGFMTAAYTGDHRDVNMTYFLLTLVYHAYLHKDNEIYWACNCDQSNEPQIQSIVCPWAISEQKYFNIIFIFLFLFVENVG